MNKENVMGSVSLVGLLVERYGPFAFGVLLLMFVWTMIAQPQIEAARIDFEQQRHLVLELKEVSTTFRLIGEQQLRTADVLQTTSKLLAETAEQIATIKSKP